LNVDASHINYKDIPFRFRGNPFDPTTANIGGCRPPDAAASPLSAASASGMAKDSRNNNGDEHRRPCATRNEVRAAGFYTWSHTSGNVLAARTSSNHDADIRAICAPYASERRPVRSFLRRLRRITEHDQKHRVTLSTLLPRAARINASGIFAITPVRLHRLERADDVSCGPDKPNCKDGYAFDLAPGVTHVNSLRGSSFSQF